MSIAVAGEPIHERWGRALAPVAWGGRLSNGGMLGTYVYVCQVALSALADRNSGRAYPDIVMRANTVT